MFAPCDNILVQKDTDTISLISVMTAVVFPTVPPDDLPPGTMAPLRWFLFSNWVISNEDVGKQFEQRVEFTIGDKVFFDQTQLMELQPGKIHHRMVAQVQSFPVVTAGTYDLKLYIREKGQQEWGEPSAIHPLLVHYL